MLSVAVAGQSRLEELGISRGRVVGAFCGHAERIRWQKKMFKTTDPEQSAVCLSEDLQTGWRCEGR